MTNRSLSTVALNLFLIAALLAAYSPLGRMSASTPAPDADQRLYEPTGNRSTAFVPDPGLTDPTLLFRTLGAAGTLFFGRDQVLFPLPCPGRVSALFSSLLGESTSDSAGAAEPAALRLQFVGGNPDTQVVGEEQLPGIVNYYIGNDPAKWRTHVPTYGSIVYKELYPGIDLLYNGSGDALKGTYIVAPGANPGGIRWRYDGASSVELSKGELLISVDEAQDPLLIERKPMAWQTVDGKRVPVGVRYVAYRDDSIGFELGAYDASYPLTIDPTLDYATYWGFFGCEGAYDIAVDSNNMVYIAGPINSVLPIDCEDGSAVDVFVTKLDPSQTGVNQLVYTTYIGGSDFDAVMAIAVDAAGKAYVGGYTSSGDVPTTVNAVQPAYRDGGSDGFVIQLDAAGAAQYVSYLGGSEFEELFQVAVTDNGQMHVVGFTDSTDFWTTPDAYTDTLQNRDAFVTVLDTSKSGAASLVYSTFFGGSGYDEGYGIDASGGIIYFAGTTDSNDLPRKNPTQADYGGGGGYGDAFAAKLDRSQSGSDQLLFSTYLGGSDMEVCGWVAANDAENMYLVGVTQSADFPTTTVSLPYGGGDADAFLVKWETAVPTLTYSIFVGGNGDDGLRDVAIDHLGNAYVAGGTGSDDLPTVDPIQDTFKGGVAPDVYDWLGAGDALIAKFDTTGAMVFGTYLGGTEFDGGLGVDLGGDGRVYVALGTRSTDLDTVNALQDANAGTYDGFVASIGGLVPSSAAITVTKTANAGTVNVGQTITYTYQVTNTGGITLSLVSATDDRLGTVNLSSASLAPASGASGTLTYTVVEGDLPGPLTNTVTVTGTPPVGDDVTGTADELVTLTSNPAITVSKAANTSSADIGETITYTYRVTNTGDVTLNSVAAHDDKLGAVTLDVTSLAPNVGTSGTLTYAVVEDDLPGPLTNTITVTGTPPVGDDVTGTADESVTLTSSPSIAVNKAASASSVKVGEMITYTYQVTNTGNVTLDSVAAYDDRLGPVTLGATSLVPDEGTSGALTYTVVEGDLPGPLTNTVTVTGTPPVGDDVTGTAGESVSLISGVSIAVTKMANVDSAEVGEMITYTYRVTNTGDVTLDPVVACDDKLGAVTLGATSLAPDAGTSGTLTYVVVEGDLSGPLENTVTVTGTPPVGNDVTRTADELITLISSPSITVTKTANVDSAKVGETITYTYRVTNTGDVTLDPVAAHDDKLGAVTLGATSLAPDAGTSGTLAYTVVEGDLPGPLANTVTAIGTPPVGDDVQETADESVALTSSPSITVTKTANGDSAGVGETITYTYRVTNTGDVTLDSVVAYDDKLGLVTLGATTLAPDEGTSGMLTHVVVENDLPGPLANTVNVTGTPPVGNDATATADATVALVAPSALTVVKTASVSTANVGQTITYTYWVTNTGDVTLDSVVAYDDKLGLVMLGAASLTPNSGTSGTLTYTVVEGDLPGPLTNTVVVTGTLSVGGDVTATADASVDLVALKKVHLPLVIKDGDHRGVRGIVKKISKF